METGQVGSECDGVTCKAVDINLHCSVTLKVISEFSEKSAVRSLYYRTSFLGPGSFGVLSFFPIPSALLESEQQKRVSLPNSTAGIASGAKLWVPVAVRLETECIMRSGCFSIHRRPSSNLRQPKHGESCCLANSHLNYDPALSRRVNRVEVRN